MQHKRNTQTGFTIVELLIVVVVIAIIAAISLVSYAGIQQRAKESVLASSLDGVAKRVEADRILDSSAQYPATLAQANEGRGIFPTNGMKYQYTVDNISPAQTFCVTGSYGEIDYRVTESAVATLGVCSGHLAGGPAPSPITNLALNPNVEVNVSNWTDTKGTRVRDVAAAKVGTYGMRMAVNEVGYYPRLGVAATVTPGNVYTISGWVRSSGQVLIAWQIPSNSVNFGPTAISNNQWVRISMTTPVIPPGTPSIVGLFSLPDNSPVGTVIDVDGVMITEGTAIPPFADGTFTSIGWNWNGTAHASTSSGPIPQ